MNKYSKTLNFRPLNDIVYDTIKLKITNLVYRPGEQLVEQRIADELGVSKSPIREAFRRLETTGLVFLVPYSGCFVSELTAKEFQEAFQLREALELYCLSRGLPKYSKKDIQEFIKLNKEAQKTLEQKDRKGAYEINLGIHGLIVKKANSHIIEKTHEDVIENKLKRYLLLVVEQINTRAKASAKEHQELTRAIEKKDVALAIDTLQHHLNSILNDYLKSKEIIQLGKQA